MNKEDYYQNFIRYMKCSPDNESINLAAIRSHTYDIYFSYKGKEISEADVKRDADIFLRGMKAGRARVAKIECFRKNTKSLVRLLKAVNLTKNQ